ncbi:MAG: hypothetical protein KIH69_012735 [Anaerolineae bacterium]|nr:hypothetical protein [Anaerolineae bacterium]
MGLHLPALDLFAYCHRYAKQPHIAVIACSPYADDWLFQQDIAFVGAKACFTQQLNQNKLLNCINIVSNGVCMFDTETLAAAHMPSAFKQILALKHFRENIIL